MKRLIAMLLALSLVLAGCAAGPGGDDLMNGVHTPSVEGDGDLNAMALAASRFGLDLLRASRSEGENTLVSPISVLYALAMTANGADGDTLNQMEQVLGMDVEGLNLALGEYLKLLPDEKFCTLHLANGIWFRDDPRLSVNQEFLETNAAHYDAAVRKAPFDPDTCREINSWVKDRTDGMIPEILDEIPEEAMLYLVNALSFEADWRAVYEEFQVRPGVFTTEDGAERDAELMHSEEGLYLETPLAEGFLKPYEDQRYAFAALLPREGVTVDELLESLDGESLRNLLAEPEKISVFASIPKFETEFSIELSETLEAMGMPDAFDSRVADFTRMAVFNGEGENICIGRVLHKTFLSVGEQGTRAGAATAVEMVAEGAVVIEDYRIVNLDRPFVYLLIDCERNLPLFIGTMMDVQGS